MRSETSSATEASAPNTAPSSNNRSDSLVVAVKRRLKTDTLTINSSTESPILKIKPNWRSSNSTRSTTNPESDVALDTRLPHRHGWPLLPSLPVRTSSQHIPKTLCPNSTHMHRLRDILTTHAVTTHNVVTTHRHHATTPLSKSTLTLLITSHVSNNATWIPALHALAAYITTHALTLCIEIIDHRIVNGVFTLPILSYDPLTPFLTRKKRGIADVLDKSGEQWTSLEFWYRGLGNTREGCKGTVLIGVPEPEKGGWWEGRDAVAEKVKEKVGGRLGVEVVWRRVVKY
ncbi:hypothetical protein T440DRAFT_519675 [Plenodomus tracheiphilus IPT5]|uniref:Uncharacterized protein n=1 Tax=Plenodomus tracheiphilus IPT5 TaxID=1408161 RepID=A0A6A7B351_9PLEO|nr:hypothetical protein T440DRAFT_519675 [Plenodomus tracheiphilus IPT5]